METPMSAVPRSSLNLDSISVNANEADWQQRAVRILSTQGCVAIVNGCDQMKCTELRTFLETTVLPEILRDDPDGVGNRGPGRYSLKETTWSKDYSHASPYIQVLESLKDKGVLGVVDALYKASEKEAYLTGCGGELCLAHTTGYQPPHGDFREKRYNIEWPPPMIECNVMIHEMTPYNGAMRIMPGEWEFNDDDGERYRGPGNCETATAMPKRAFLEDSLMLTKQLFPLPAGTVFLRDVRVVHGGCPNNSDSHRWMPSFSFLSHAYLKEMNWLNEHWVFGKIADVHPQNIWKNSVRKIRKEYHYVDGRLLRWSDRWPDERCLYGCQPETKPANIQYNLSREQTGNDFTLSDVNHAGSR